LPRERVLSIGGKYFGEALSDISLRRGQSLGCSWVVAGQLVLGAQLLSAFRWQKVVETPERGRVSQDVGKTP